MFEMFFVMSHACTEHNKARPKAELLRLSRSLCTWSFKNQDDHGGGARNTAYKSASIDERTITGRGNIYTKEENKTCTPLHGTHGVKHGW